MLQDAFAHLMLQHNVGNQAVIERECVSQDIDFVEVELPVDCRFQQRFKSVDALFRSCKPQIRQTSNPKGWRAYFLDLLVVKVVRRPRLLEQACCNRLRRGIQRHVRDVHPLLGECFSKSNQNATKEVCRVTSLLTAPIRSARSGWRP